VKNQIDAWLKNKVIEVAQRNTSFNSPLFVIARKNPAIGEYDGYKVA
jgi:hypothetical protein